ncbi:MAG: divalent metal cation transporter [Deltaproteobacteria bacterium]|nr:divalent metal cation transporter [Deltaproteobacteria bacterium]
MTEGSISNGDRRGLWASLGPGILFTGAAVGVSHLVQSTRAGAMFGLGFIGIVIVANVVKYSAFRAGPHYAAATGTSLLEGYRRQGTWALVLYSLLTVGTMFTVQAAVTMLTAGLLIAVLGLDGPLASPLALSAVLTVVCAGVLAAGHFHWLDRIGKVLVSVLTVSTVIAAAVALPKLDLGLGAGASSLLPSAEMFSPAALPFVVALVGWMPSAIDVSVWQSLWTLAREKDSGHRPTLRESMFDFHLGYFGTAFLALCFVVLGAALVHGKDVEIASGAGAFAGQVVSLYTEALGEWSRPLIGVAAFATMFSTTLTVIDGFPRALSVLWARFRGPEEPGEAGSLTGSSRRVYWASLVLLGLGALGIIAFMVQNLLVMVDVATTLSFLTAPVLAWLNHRAVLGSEVREHARPSRGLTALSAGSILVLAIFAVYYLVLRFGT